MLDFLAEDINIWKAAKYLDPSKSLAFDKIPPFGHRKWFGHDKPRGAGSGTLHHLLSRGRENRIN
jgi:hypothetical protein